MCAAPTAPAVAPLDTTAPRRARARCPRCQRPQATCLCRFVTPTANQVSLLILQHPHEQHQAKGSARLLQLSLARCRVEVGECFDAAALAGWLAEPTPSGPAKGLLLFPEAAGGIRSPAVGPTAAGAAPLPQPVGIRLVLLDGTWRQARRLLRANPLLQALPRWPLPAPPPSRYAIRQAHRPEQRSTLEAVCLALGTLEGQAAVYAPLLDAFDDWVVAVTAVAAIQRSADLTASAIVDSARPSLAA